MTFQTTNLSYSVGQQCKLGGDLAIPKMYLSCIAMAWIGTQGKKTQACKTNKLWESAGVCMGREARPGQGSRGWTGITSRPVGRRTLGTLINNRLPIQLGPMRNVVSQILQSSAYW